MTNKKFKLYQHDVADEVKTYYLDQLKRGKTNEDLTLEIIEYFKDYIQDMDDEPIFWFALADTQWNVGRLLPIVKDKALSFVEKFNNNNLHMINKQVIDELKVKLSSPLPALKKISQYKIYKCTWKFGDVFAYRFHLETSKMYNLYNKYIIFRKVSEGEYWPGHICPVVHVYNWFSDELPELDQIKNLECIPTFLHSEPRKFQLKIITESIKKIPNEYLTYIGNIENTTYPLVEHINDFPPCTTWKEIEESIILDIIRYQNMDSLEIIKNLK